MKLAVKLHKEASLYHKIRLWFEKYSKQCKEGYTQLDGAYYYYTFQPSCQTIWITQTVPDNMSICNAILEYLNE